MTTIDQVKMMLRQMQQDICAYTPQQTAAALGYAHAALVAMEYESRILHDKHVYRIRELESRLKTTDAARATAPTDGRLVGAVPK